MIQYSLIVPVYKVEKYIRRCVDSILAQTCEDFELILVDDGSPDQSGRICDAYAGRDERIRVIHKENGGVSSARNAGLDAAGGKYIVFIDSDDAVSSDYLSCMDVSEADLVVAGVRNITPDGKTRPGLSYPDEFVKVRTGDVSERMLGDKALNFIYSKRYRADLIRNADLRFAEGISLGEDTLFVAQYLCLCESVQYVSECPYDYYQYEGTTLSSFDGDYVSKLMQSNALIAQALDARFPGISESTAWKKRIWSVFHYSIFYILRQWNVGVFWKYSTIRHIFAMPEYQGFCPLMDRYMPEESGLWRRLFRYRSALALLIIWKLVQMKTKWKGHDR